MRITGAGGSGRGGAVADNSFTHLVVVGSSAGGIGALSGLVVTPEEATGYVEDDGLGLRSIKERAALLEGGTEVYSSPEGGAGVRVRLPLLNGGR